MKIERIRHLIEFFFIYIITIILNFLPINFVSYSGGLIFKFLGPLTKSHDTAKKNYLRIFKFAKSKDVKKDVLMSWENLGKTFFELLILPKFISKANNKIKIEGIEKIKLNKYKKNYIFIGIHQSNWELIVPIINKLGFDIGAVYRHINNPFINNLILKKRTQSLVNNNSFYTPKGKQSAIDLIKNIKINSSIVVIIDQKDSAGEDVPFFGIDVKTQTGFLKIAKKNNIQIVPVQNTRKDLNNFIIKFHKPIELKEYEFNTCNEMTKIHSLIEDWIKENPSNWFLQHNRFY